MKPPFFHSSVRIQLLRYLNNRAFWLGCVLCLLLVGLSACQMVGPPAVMPPTPARNNLPAPAVHQVSTQTVIAGNIPIITLTFAVEPSPTPSSTSTPDPYYAWTIDYLKDRQYGGGEIQAQETLLVTSYYTRTLISYPSDGLTIYGFVNVPRGEGPFPVVVALHGYIEPAIYQTLDYTTGYADALARAGYLVLHPNLRGYPPSDEGEDLFRVGMAVDVLNLIALVQEHSGKPGLLEKADAAAIGLWGHSMGGGITTRVITVNPAVRAAVLYAAMSGDERQNYEAILSWSDGERGLEEQAFPEEQLIRVSPIYYLEHIQAAVSIHHGVSDEIVPLKWSQDLCQRLQSLGKTVECFDYPKMPHTFYEEGNDLFNQRVIEFFNRQLRP